MSAVTSSLTPEGAPLPRITLRQLAETLRQAHVSVACHGDEASAVLGMTVDSREVEAGNLFVCKGAAFKPQYLLDAADEHERRHGNGNPLENKHGEHRADEKRHDAPTEDAEHKLYLTHIQKT